MNNCSILPKYKVVYYENNPETGLFTKTIQQPEITPVMRLPYELKVEPTQLHQIKCNALQIIRGKEKSAKGNYKFFTGLQETDFKQWYSGNYCEWSKGKKILSLCLFHFAGDNSRMTVFYFGRYYIDKREAREQMIISIIPELIKRHFL